MYEGLTLLQWLLLVNRSPSASPKLCCFIVLLLPLLLPTHPPISTNCESL
jgi:hypothetical protein